MTPRGGSRDDEQFTVPIGGGPGLDPVLGGSRADGPVLSLLPEAPWGPVEQELYDILGHDFEMHLSQRGLRVPDYVKSPHLVAGGQGRSAASVLRDGRITRWVLVGLFAGFVLVVRVALIVGV